MSDKNKTHYGLNIAIVLLIVIVLYWLFMVIFGGFGIVDTPHGMTVAGWWLIPIFVIDIFIIGAIVDDKS
jgi:lipopolysaccharide export LptBFGC system permease protein LptF